MHVEGREAEQRKGKGGGDEAAQEEHKIAGQVAFTLLHNRLSGKRCQLGTRKHTYLECAGKEGDAGDEEEKAAQARVTQKQHEIL